MNKLTFTNELEPPMPVLTLDCAGRWIHHVDGRAVVITVDEAMALFPKHADKIRAAMELKERR